jgi:integrase
VTARRHPALQGIETRHRKACADRSNARCNCQPSYRGVVYDQAAKRNRSGPWSPSVAQARAWRNDALRTLQRRGTLAASSETVRQAAEKWLVAAKRGQALNNAGRPYKPSTLRGYTSSLELHVLPSLGAIKLAKLKRRDVQALVDRLVLTLDGMTVRNALMPLRVLCRRAVVREVIETNPCDHLELPAATRRRFTASPDGLKREQIATPAEADQLIKALSDLQDRAIWATAFYAGLRRGELRGLFCEDVDLDAGLIKVRRGWDLCEGEIAEKTAAGKRDIPIPAKLADLLVAHFASHDGRTFAFPGYGRWGHGYGAFSADALLKRSRKAWRAKGLQAIGLHEARHTYASMLIDAGVPIAKVSRRMGHSSIAVTERVYYWAVPSSFEQERQALDTYLSQA